MTLICVSSAGYASHALEPATSVVIGRAPGCGIVIDDASISRHHVRLVIGARLTLSITDLDSANGTLVRGQPIPPHRPIPVRPGEAITLGKALLVVQAPAEVRGALPRAELLRAVEARCEEARETNLPFRVASIRTRDELAESEVTAIAGHELGTPDLLGRLEPRTWVMVVDDVPPGRAMTTIKQVSERLRGRSVTATIGIAVWPRDGGTAADLLVSANGLASRKRGPTAVVVGRATAALFETVDRIAASSLPVLLMGETGVGKEIVAHRIHAGSARADKPLLKLNCAAFTEQLLESELFGHVRGSFTGADQNKPGLLVSADGGTVLLDEIGEMPLPMQAKLLRVLEDGEVRHVGAVESRHIDVRFIAASNRQLDDPRQFRPDLYFRVSGAVIEIPPLRDRVDEILPLAHKFLDEVSERHGIDPPILGDGAIRVLTTYGWPGNVRELRNAVERAAIVCDGKVIEPTDFPIFEMKTTPVPGPSPFSSPGSEGPTEVVLSRQSPSRETIIAVLAAHGGNQVLAAEALGIHRRTLMRWMDLMKITRPRKG